MPQEANKCILSICDISSARRGSFEEFLISLTEKLCETKITHIVVFREKPTKIVEEALLEKGAQIIIFKASKFNMFNFFPLYQIINKTKPEIVHFHFYPSYTIINYLSFFLKIKIIYTDHMAHSKKADRFFKKMIRWTYYHTNSKLFDSGINCIVCVSNFVKEKYYREYGVDSKKFRVIYNGINTERFKKINNTKKIKEKYKIKDEFVVSCVGLSEEKGSHYLINAAPEIITKIPNVKFVLVGEGKLRSYLEERISELNIKNHVIFTGNTDHIEEIYNISSCVTIPTLGDEAFCFVAAEAMATETPIVAFDSGALKEIIYDKSNVVSINSKSLADKIIDCLKNGDALSRNAREHVVRNFSLDRNVCQYVEMYKEMFD